MDEQPGITEAGVARIEAALGVKLPGAHARELLTEAADPLGDSFYSSAEDVTRYAERNRRP